MNNPPTVVLVQPVISENGNVPTQSQPSSTAIDKLLKANFPVAVWLIFLAFGGGILALYYSRIRYLPNIEWKAALVYLFVASMLGGIIGLTLTLSLYLPGVIWSEFLIFDPSINVHFSYKLRYKDPSGNVVTRHELCISSIIRCLGLPFLSLLFVSHLVLLFPPQPVPPSLSESSVIKTIDPYWLISLILAALTFFWMRWILSWRLLPQRGGFWTRWTLSMKNAGPSEAAEKMEEQENPSETDEDPKKRLKETILRQIFKHSCWFTLSVLLNQISMYMIYRLSGPRGFFDFSVLTLMCVTGVWISTHVVALRHRYFPYQALIASLMTAGLLLFAADSFSPLSQRLMSYYGFGGDPKVSVILSGHGVEVVNQLGVKRCDASTLCDVEVLSKMGDEYFLKVGEQGYIALAKPDVIAIKR
jgi:hypothetical protein